MAGADDQGVSAMDESTCIMGTEGGRTRHGELRTRTRYVFLSPSRRLPDAPAGRSLAMASPYPSLGNIWP